MLKKTLWFIVFTLLVYVQVDAREITTYVGETSVPQQFFSMRAMGMGNAFTALADDATGLMYNPAALARRKSGVFKGGLGGGFSLDFFEFLGDFEDVANNEAVSEADRIDNVISFLNDNAGKVFHTRLPRIYGAYARPNWGIVVTPMDTTTDIIVRKAGGGPSLNLNLTQDTTFAFGYGRNVNWFKKWFGLSGDLSVGVTAKLINRIFLGNVISAASAVTGGDVLDTDGAAEGVTVDADLGMMFTPKIPDKGWMKVFKAAKPTFSMVLRNALDMGFTTSLDILGENSNQPPNLGRRIDFGSLWDLPDFWVFDPQLSVDLKDVLHENWSLTKGVKVGAELGWKMFNWWKGSWTVGFNDGYYTLGVGARFAWFNLDLLTYGQEMGTTDNPSESRRYMLEMGLEF